MHPVPSRRAVAPWRAVPRRREDTSPIVTLAYNVLHHIPFPAFVSESAELRRSYILLQPISSNLASVDVNLYAANSLSSCPSMPIISAITSNPDGGNKKGERSAFPKLNPLFLITFDIYLLYIYKYFVVFALLLEYDKCKIFSFIYAQLFSFYIFLNIQFRDKYTERKRFCWSIQSP